MTTGALIFAANNGITDYEAMARWSASNIERHLGIPTHIVTETDDAGHNTRSFPGQGHIAWHNSTRCDAYRHSPWQRTLVLDADYVVASDMLRPLLTLQRDFVAHSTAFDVTGCNDFRGLRSFGEHAMPMWWATVMMFRRSPHAELIFDTMRMIRDNWSHYRNLYKIRQTSFRNDHALTIALLICDGHNIHHDAIPWPLATVMPEHELSLLSQDRYRVQFVRPDNRARWTEISQDFHAMNKSQLEAVIANHG